MSTPLRASSRCDRDAVLGSRRREQRRLELPTQAVAQPAEQLVISEQPRDVRPPVGARGPVALAFRDSQVARRGFPELRNFGSGGSQCFSRAFGCGRPFLQAAARHPEPAVAAIKSRVWRAAGRQDGAFRRFPALSGAFRRFPALSGAFSMLGPLLQQQIEHVGRPRVAARAAGCGLVAGLRRVQQHAGHVHVHACACACM